MTVTQMVDSVLKKDQYLHRKNDGVMTQDEAITFAEERMGLQGLGIREGIDFRKIIPVDKKALDAILEQDKKEWIKWNGNCKSTTKVPDMIKNHVMSSVKKEDRLSASWTISQALHEQGSKFLRIIKEHNPKWVYGQPFDSKILDEPHIDTRI